MKLRCFIQCLHVTLSKTYLIVQSMNVYYLHLHSRGALLQIILRNEIFVGQSFAIFSSENSTEFCKIYLSIFQIYFRKCRKTAMVRRALQGDSSFSDKIEANDLLLVWRLVYLKLFLHLKSYLVALKIK